MRPLDKQDAEHIEQIRLTRGYDLLHQRYAAMLETARRELEEAPIDKVPRLQERVALLRRIIMLPGVLIGEGKS